MIPHFPLHWVAQDLYADDILSLLQVGSQIHAVIEPHFSVAFGRSDLDQKSINVQLIAGISGNIQISILRDFSKLYRSAKINDSGRFLVLMDPLRGPDPV